MLPSVLDAIQEPAEQSRGLFSVTAAFRWDSVQVCL